LNIKQEKPSGPLNDRLGLRRRRRRGEPSPARGVAAPSRLHAPQPVAGERDGCTAPQPAATLLNPPARGAAARRPRVCCSEGGERLRERRRRLRMLGGLGRRRGRGTAEIIGGGESGAEGEESRCGVNGGRNPERGRDPSRASGPGAGRGWDFPVRLSRAQLRSSI
jgi:hypothetical protein